MGTRLEIPIPQPEPAFEFVEGKRGLLEFHAETTEAHIAAFRAVNQGIDEHYWSQAAVVASLTKKYGEKGQAIDDMAEAVELSASYLRRMAQTYRTFQYMPRDTSLSFSHHKAACRHPDPSAALAVAKANGFSKNELEAWVSEQSLRRATKATQQAKRAVRNDWREHLMHMDQVIADDFIALSPNKEFARRVVADWRQDIADELHQLEITESRERIMDAVDNRGAEDLKAIQKTTGIKKEDVGWIVKRLVEENLYEWIPKGGKGDDQRGSPSMILHKVGEPDGGAFTVARTVNQYAH